FRIRHAGGWRTPPPARESPARTDWLPPCRHHPHLDPGCLLRHAIDAHRGCLEVFRPCLEDIRHEGLRVAVHIREPAALHLYHDPVATLEGMVHVGHGEAERVRPVWRECDWRLEAAPEPAAEWIAADQLLVATHDEPR